VAEEAKRYVVVNADGDVVGGPYLWDGEQAWTPPVEGKLILESELESK